MAAPVPSRFVLAMQKVEGSSPFIRFTEPAGSGGFFCGREPLRRTRPGRLVDSRAYLGASTSLPGPLPSRARCSRTGRRRDRKHKRDPDAPDAPRAATSCSRRGSSSLSGTCVASSTTRSPTRVSKGATRSVVMAFPPTLLRVDPRDRPRTPRDDARASHGTRGRGVHAEGLREGLSGRDDGRRGRPRSRGGSGGRNLVRFLVRFRHEPAHFRGGFGASSGIERELGVSG